MSLDVTINLFLFLEALLTKIAYWSGIFKIFEIVVC